MQLSSKQPGTTKWWPWLIVLFFQLSVSFGFSADNNHHLTGIDSLKMVAAQRITAGKVKIDGILDEDVWHRAQLAEGFLQNEPEEGQPASQRTRFQVAYDDHAIYVAMVAYEQDPSEITSYLSRRDSDIPCDWLAVIIDSYDDKRTAFAFGVNPAGVKLDGMMDNTGDLDNSWDAVWDVKT
ncbi:MAG: carbohydrate binding family 9 domain-containing protein, partial [candidate division KSB1 bacterium]|nr:carbohydrate binding family 9 domain-containing protein [candidate division KSB1 bacterium]